MTTKPTSWDDLRFLLAVHRDRSFFAAGKSLGVAPSTVARRVEAIERRLGRVLVHRGNDGTQLDATEQAPEGVPIQIAPERPEEFSPGADPELIALIEATAAMEMADIDATFGRLG